MNSIAGLNWNNAGYAALSGPLLALVYDCFCEDDQFKRQRILKPLLCDQKAFDTLVATRWGKHPAWASA